MKGKMEDNSSAAGKSAERLAKAIAGSMRQEWPYMNRVDREEISKKYARAFEVSGLSLDDAEREIDESEFDE